MNTSNITSNRIKNLCFYVSYDTRKCSLRVVAGVFLRSHKWIYPLEAINGWKLECKSEAICQSVLSQILSTLDKPVKDLVTKVEWVDNIVRTYKPLLKI